MKKMRAKLQRLCAVTNTGKLKVSPEIHEMWSKAGKVRDDMVALMVEAEGCKDPMCYEICSPTSSTLCRL